MYQVNASAHWFPTPLTFNQTSSPSWCDVNFVANPGTQPDFGDTCAITSVGPPDWLGYDTTPVTITFFFGSSLCWDPYGIYQQSFASGVQKTTVHEMVHTLDNSDQPANVDLPCYGQINGESAMNWACGANDHWDNVAAYVTDCDFNSIVARYQDDLGNTGGAGDGCTWTTQQWDQEVWISNCRVTYHYVDTYYCGNFFGESYTQTGWDCTG